MFEDDSVVDEFGVKGIASLGPIDDNAGVAPGLAYDVLAGVPGKAWPPGASVADHGGGFARRRVTAGNPVADDGGVTMATIREPHGCRGRSLSNGRVTCIAGYSLVTDW